MRLLWISGLTTAFFSILLLVAGAGWSRAAGGGTAVTFVKDGMPINGTVRLLCYSAPGEAPHSDLLLAVAGGIAAQPLPPNCSYAAALEQLHIQPSGLPDHGPAYTVYHTSWTPGTGTPNLITDTFHLSSENNLTLFHVVVSLGWEPAAGTLELDVADMTAALRGASANLYDLTEGQMAFGPVTIHSGGAGWDSADFRVLPANDQRPAAFVGGIIKDSTLLSGASSTTQLTPAGIYLGRSWDAARGPTATGSGLWTAVPTGTNTLIHEWGHYALFLFDEYQQDDGLSHYCTCDDLPNASGCGLGDLDASAMGYHYTAEELWHDNVHVGVATSFCFNTWNRLFHENTDWKIVANWGFLQSLPVQAISYPTTLAKQLPGMTADLFGTAPGQPTYLPLLAGGSAAPITVVEPIIDLRTASLPSSAAVHAAVYLLEGGSSNPTRILYQGQPVGPPSGDSAGEMTLVGVGNADRVRAFVTRYTGGARYSFPPTSLEDTAVTAGGQLYADLQPWEYELSHRFAVQGGLVTTLTVALQETAVANPPMAQLCSIDAAIGCSADWQITMTDNGGNWLAIFNPLPGMTELPRHAIMRITSPELGVKGEIIRWVQVHGGVGPGHGDAIAPLADGQVMINTPTAITGPGDCNIASFAPAASNDALAASLPQGVQGIVGAAYEVRISLTLDQACPNWLPGQNATFTPVVLNMGYEQADIDLLGVDESTLVLLHLTPAGWVQVFTNFAGRNAELNWISEAVQEDGIFAIGWTQ
jgi:hypothetical protein